MKVTINAFAVSTREPWPWSRRICGGPGEAGWPHSGVPLSAQMFPWPEAPRFGARSALDASFMDYLIPGLVTACVSPRQEPQLSGAFTTTEPQPGWLCAGAQRDCGHAFPLPPADMDTVTLASPGSGTLGEVQNVNTWLFPAGARMGGPGCG